MFGLVSAVTFSYSMIILASMNFLCDRSPAENQSESSKKKGIRKTKMDMGGEKQG